VHQDVRPGHASLINQAGRTLRWFIEDVWDHFDTDHTWPGAPLDHVPKRMRAHSTGLSLAWGDLHEAPVERHVVAEEIFDLADGPGGPMRTPHGLGRGVPGMDDPHDACGGSDIGYPAHRGAEDEASVLADRDIGERGTPP
jgi:hypothetical protein